MPTIVGALAAAATLALLIRRLPADEPPSGAVQRRDFLLGGAAAAGVAAVAGFGGRGLQHARYDVAAERSTVALPGKRRTGTVPTGVDLGKSGRPWATPSSDFYRIDTALSVPELSSHDWQLRIHGMVDKPLTLSYAEVLKRPMIERWITLCCVSNPVGGPLVGNAYWQGTRLADLLREAGIHHDSDQLLLTSSDGMTIGAPTKVVMDGRDALLAVGMNGAPLPIEHGYPARIVVPGLYGYVSACKWVVDINATTFDDARAYWPQGGWTSGQLETSIELQSRIDTPRAGRAGARRSAGRHRRRRLGPARRRVQGRGAGRRRPVAAGPVGAASRRRTPGGSGCCPGRRRAPAATACGSAPSTAAAGCSPSSAGRCSRPARPGGTPSRPGHEHVSGPLTLVG